MITVKINGQQVQWEQPMTIQQYLQTQNHSTDRVAVEQNGRIVPKSTYAEQQIKDGDTLEVVSFVGGG